MLRRNLGKTSKTPDRNHLSVRLVLGCGLLAAALGACRPSGRAEISADERVLVATYVRIAVLDVWRGDDPDSARVALDKLAASPDTAAVRRALVRLQESPQRWEAVWDAIAKQLHDLESQPTPAVALRVLDGRPPGAPPPKPAARSPAEPQLPAQPRVAPADSLSAGARAKSP
jgi:hypothetical protein